GKISLSLLELKKLNHLDLSWNDFQGKTIPEYIGSLSELSYLDLSGASFSGLVPPHLGNLSNLRYLNLRKLCKLQLLYLSNNDISGETVDLVAVLSGCGNASLEALQLVGNKLSGQIPGSTGHFKQLRSRYLQSNSFSGSIPSSIGSLNDLETLDLSSNAMNGTIPDSIGQLSKLVSLNLKWNSWIGKIPNWLGKLSPQLFLQDLSEFRSGAWVDLSSNFLEGSLPIWYNEMSLSHLDLSRNNLFGDIPDSSCFSPYLQVLKLFSNNFSGELSPSLQNCTGLILLDLEENRLSGSITEWVGDNLSILSALPRGNMFSGNIPEQLSPSSYEQDPPDFTVSYRQSMDLIVKGRQLEYNLTLGIVNVLDLSSNNLKGEISD
ncbi:hypothetical protein D5086_019443, partial [Populus alba]